MAYGKGVGNGTTPIMCHQDEFLMSQVFYQLPDKSKDELTLSVLPIDTLGGVKGIRTTTFEVI